jgi:hypothetical protein
LFGSGVPVLTLATYLFTVIGAVDYPNPAGESLCSQLWSEWLLATGSLFIGSAVLVCGLGWALVSYADNLAVTLCETNIPIKTVEEGRRFFIRLNAWLAAAVTTAPTALLIVTTVLYLTAIGQQNMHFEIFGIKWYLCSSFIYLACILSPAHLMSFLIAHAALGVRTRNRVPLMPPMAHLSPQITKA